MLAVRHECVSKGPGERLERGEGVDRTAVGIEHRLAPEVREDRQPGCELIGCQERHGNLRQVAEDAELVLDAVADGYRTGSGDQFHAEVRLPVSPESAAVGYERCQPDVVVGVPEDPRLSG